jgi:signal transduction histidine kinase
MEKFNELGKYWVEFDKNVEDRMNELQNKILNLTELTKETNEITQTNVNNITDVIQYVRLIRFSFQFNYSSSFC